MSHPVKFPSYPDRMLSSELPDVAHNSSICVVLLPASDWQYEISDRPSLVGDQVPPLSKFLDAVMTFWLHISSSMYSEQLQFALHIGSLISYCYMLEDKAQGSPIAVRSVEYAARLKPEHRELHYDIVGPHKDRFYMWTGEPAHRYLRE